VGVLKFPKLGLPWLWRPITLSISLQLIWSFKKSYGRRQELSNDMWHATCMQGNLGDSWLLVIGSQIGNLTPDPSFDHNLCFKCPNGSCEPISNIYVSRVFQWYKGHFNLMSFDLCNCPLKIWKSIETPTPKMGAHLGVWGFLPSHSPTLLGAWNVTPGLPFWPITFQALALVVSPRLGLRHKHYKE